MELTIEHGSPEATAFYQACGRNSFTLLDDTLVVAREGGQIVGLIRLCLEHGHYMLRSMQVRDDYQGKGLGKAMLARFAAELADREIQESYCFAFAHLEKFYGSIGYRKIEKQEAPEFLRARYDTVGAAHPGEAFVLLQRP